MDVVQPVHQVEEGEDDGEDDTRPLVYGVDVRQVRDLHLELRGPPPQAALLVGHGAVQGGPAVHVPAGHGLAILYAGAVVGEHGDSWVVERPHHVSATHLVGEVGQQDVAVGVHLKNKMPRCNFISGMFWGIQPQNSTYLRRSNPFRT